MIIKLRCSDSQFKYYSSVITLPWFITWLSITWISITHQQSHRLDYLINTDKLTQLIHFLWIPQESFVIVYRLDSLDFDMLIEFLCFLPTNSWVRWAQVSMQITALVHQEKSYIYIYALVPYFEFLHDIFTITVINNWTAPQLSRQSYTPSVQCIHVVLCLKIEVCSAVTRLLDNQNRNHWAYR